MEVGDLLLASTYFLSLIYHWLKVANSIHHEVVWSGGPDRSGKLLYYGVVLTSKSCTSLLVRATADTSRMP
jgi:hypothetical protein